jgi:K+-transporting ATPase KdpF subunit
VGREAWSARIILSAAATLGHPMSAENWIELIGGIALVVYLFVALTHPEWF